MSRRNSKQVPEQQIDAPRLLSEFVDNPDPKLRHFVLRWIPRPPNVKHEVVQDIATRGLSERVTLAIGCPHCHEDVMFRYDVETATRPLLSRLSDAIAEFRSLEYALLRQATGRPRVLERLADVAEELSQKLRIW